MTRLSSLLGLCALSTLVWACVAAGGGDAIDDGGDGGSGGSGSGGDPTTTTNSGGGFTGPGGSGSGGSSGELYDVYGHGPNDLYQLDPESNNLVTLVGPFTDCTSGILDIAIDKDNNIFGVTAEALWSIDRGNGSCTLIADGLDLPNSLSFVPKGTLDANVEALVGYKQAAYVRIDPQTGFDQTISATALTGGMESSGDVVSIDGGSQGNKTYLTVRGTPQCDATDCLIEIDPVTGAMVQNFGSVGYDDVFGLAFWGGSAYGFSRTGDVFEITFNGSSVSSTAVSLAGLDVEEFWGAGSSTLVPLLPPQ
jgi:hypothetical protein